MARVIKAGAPGTAKPARAATRVLEPRPADGRELLKVNPLVDWDRKRIWSYLFEHDLPYNPLHDQGYVSIGCQPCTRAVVAAEDERAGRWSGTAKTECGLHSR